MKETIFEANIFGNNILDNLSSKDAFNKMSPLTQSFRSQVDTKYISLIDTINFDLTMVPWTVLEGSSLLIIH